MNSNSFCSKWKKISPLWGYIDFINIASIVIWSYKYVTKTEMNLKCKFYVLSYQRYSVYSIFIGSSR